MFGGKVHISWWCVHVTWICVDERGVSKMLGTSEQVGSTGSCGTREMIYKRTSGGVNGAKKGARFGYVN
jgi:hypothetical protein